MGLSISIVIGLFWNPLMSSIGQFLKGNLHILCCSRILPIAFSQSFVMIWVIRSLWTLILVLVVALSPLCMLLADRAICSTFRLPMAILYQFIRRHFLRLSKPLRACK